VIPVLHWFPLALLTALAVASQDAWVKRFFASRSAYHMLGYPALYSLPLFLIAAPLVPKPPIGPAFWWTFWLGVPLNGISFFLYMIAIRRSPLSLTVPYLAFTPAFMILTGALFLGEVPRGWGLVGIFIVCVGGYILNIDPRRWHLLSPIQAVFQETGSWLMLIVSFMFGFGAVIGKKGILASSPLFFNLWFFVAFNICLLATLRLSGKIRFRDFGERPLAGLAAGLFYFFHAVFHCLAIVRVKAAYMIAVKRISVLISVIYGRYVFQERHLFIRFTGAVFMVVGTAVISIFGR
jgi:drug/metabolite transporter (DMT)-like permease